MNYPLLEVSAHYGHSPCYPGSWALIININHGMSPRERPTLTLTLNLTSQPPSQGRLTPLFLPKTGNNRDLKKFNGDPERFKTELTTFTTLVKTPGQGRLFLFNTGELSGCRITTLTLTEVGRIERASLCLSYLNIGENGIERASLCLSLPK